MQLGIVFSKLHTQNTVNADLYKKTTHFSHTRKHDTQNIDYCN